MVNHLKLALAISVSLLAFSAKAEEPVLPPAAPSPITPGEVTGVTVPPVPAAVATQPAPAPTAVSAPDPANPNAVNLPPKPEQPQLRSIKKDIENGEIRPEIAEEAVPDYPKSLMFKQDDLDKLDAVYQAYLERLRNQASQVAETTNAPDVKELLEKLKMPTRQEDLKEPPASIYLNSILYHDAKNATVWINGKKFENKAEIDGVRIADITPGYVDLVFQTASYRFDFEKWQRIFPAVKPQSAEDEKKIVNPSMQNIKVNPDSNEIIFRLKPNQRLDFAQQAIREGKISPSSNKVEPNQNPDENVNADPSVLTSPASPIRMIEENTDQPEVNNPVAEKTSSKEMTEEYEVSPDGHFYVPAEADKYGINFKVDTGATVTAISNDQAKEMGMNLKALKYNITVKLADGKIVNAAQGNVKEFTVGKINLKNVPVLVSQAPLAEPLLGMSFFSKLKRFTIEGNKLILVN